MELQNSYIFLKNPSAEEEPNKKRLDDGTIVLSIGKNLYSYIKDSFPAITDVEGYGDFYKKKYISELRYDNVNYEIEFIITEVIDIEYLDVVVKGKTKAQIVKCLENIQHTFLASGVRERYIDIISYDAVSEYYCNRIYPKLNTLERNLRKLLFNTYIVNFGCDYYKATIEEELQGKIKGVIKKDSNKTERERFKAEYKIKTSKEIEEIERLQRFFYSFEYSDIQNLLFSPRWTRDDEMKKTKFLDANKNLSELSDEKLRQAFSRYIPRSDWERFFSSKIDILDIRDLIEQIRLYRNCVAHFKFFYKDQYDECNKIANRLNCAIIEAIRLTEEKDFAEKNAEFLAEAIKPVLEKFAAFTKSFAEAAMKTMRTAIAPTLSEIFKGVQEKNGIKIRDKLEKEENDSFGFVVNDVNNKQE